MKKLLFGLIGMMAIAWLFAGCGHREPLNYTSGGETQPGPGLFSGEEGAFIIYQK